ncbi:MAG: fibronectin type III domain-containing protein, partial [Thermoguttaceae bacterium]
EPIYIGPNTNFVDTGLDAGTEYTYRVRNYDEDSLSAWSNLCTVTTLGVGLLHTSVDEAVRQTFGPNINLVLLATYALGISAAINEEYRDELFR